MKGGFRLVVILFVVCGVAAGSLAFVNAATKERIAEFARVEKMEALKIVFPEAQSFAETSPGKAWDAMKGSEKIGTVLLTTIQGYSGPIEIVFGQDPQGVVTGAKVLSHTETPGLGAKITTAQFIDQFKGKTRAQLVLKKDDPTNGAIDAISAATISSRAVTKAVRDAVDGTAGSSIGSKGGN